VIPAENGLRNAVFIVSGGFKVSLAEVDEFEETLRRDLEAGKMGWECYCNATQVTVGKKKPDRA